MRPQHPNNDTLIVNPPRYPRFVAGAALLALGVAVHWMGLTLFTFGHRPLAPTYWGVLLKLGSKPIGLVILGIVSLPAAAGLWQLITWKTYAFRRNQPQCEETDYLGPFARRRRTVTLSGIEVKGYSVPNSIRSGAFPVSVKTEHLLLIPANNKDGNMLAANLLGRIPRIEFLDPGDALKTAEKIQELTGLKVS